MIRRRHPSTVTVVALVAVVSAACVSNSALATTKTTTAAKSSKSAKTFPVKSDTIEAKVRAVQQKASPGLDVGDASCDKLDKAPAGKTTIGCSIPVEGTSVPYRAVITMSAVGTATFTVRATKVPIDTRVLVGFVREVLEPDARDAATVDCGERRVRVVEPGESIRCTAQLDGERERFVFRITDMAGTVEMSR
jgi:hypothetical protein